MKILFVCHGNMNRSAFAEVYLRKLRPKWKIASVGFKISAKSAAKKARDAAERYDCDLSEHTPTLIDKKTALAYDYVFFMDGGNEKRLRELLGSKFDDSRHICIATYIGETRIADPNFSTATAPAIFDTLARAVKACAKSIKKGGQTKNIVI